MKVAELFLETLLLCLQSNYPVLSEGKEAQEQNIYLWE